MPRFDQFAHPRFVDALVTYADQYGALGIQSLRDDYKALFDQMRAIPGEGSAVVNSSMSGKSFSFEITMTLEDKVAAYAEALRIIDGTSITTTRGCFPNIDR